MNKISQMNVLISKLVTNTNTQVPSWADCRESEMTLYQDVVPLTPLAYT